ncbi:hypothetical protein BB560_005027 [Smittium megazygosporum]|uniref:J domain-containing protein n=1 Tax=Smittium megazygosporum TaxID=133381 RepID=A0A2T9Z7L7_9FUNG|nr:hypothetical protein BB560_005027 [Smittium megazygosporum]
MNSASSKIPNRQDPQDRELELYFKSQITQVNRHTEVERILNSSKLDPFYMLQVSDDCDEKIIRNSYRKLSLLIHPDKTTHPRAREAFEKLKVAQEELLNEKQRKWLQGMLDDARQIVFSEAGIKVDDNNKETKRDEKLEEKVHLKFRELQVELEWNRQEKLKKKEWEESRENRVSSWRDFQANSKSKKRSRPANKSFTQDPNRPYIKRKV